MVTASSSLSTVAVWASLMFQTPIPLAAENLTTSLVQEITTDLLNCHRSRTYHNKLAEASKPKTSLPLWNAPASILVVLRNTEVLLVKLHQFHIVVRDLLLVRRLVHEADSICLFLSLHGDVIASSAPIHISFNTKNIIDLRHT